MFNLTVSNIIFCSPGRMMYLLEQSCKISPWINPFPGAPFLFLLGLMLLLTSPLQGIRPQRVRCFLIEYKIFRFLNKLQQIGLNLPDSLVFGIFPFIVWVSGENIPISIPHSVNFQHDSQHWLNHALGCCYLPTYSDLYLLALMGWTTGGLIDCSLIWKIPDWRTWMDWIWMGRDSWVWVDLIWILLVWVLEDLFPLW